MKTGILFALFSFLLMGRVFAQPAASVENRTPPSAAKQMEKSGSTLMMIDPKLRALDYKQAFDVLRREKSSSKVFIQLRDGSMLSNIIEMNLMDNSTLIFFKYNTAQGIKLQVVSIEEIQEINYL